MEKPEPMCAKRPHIPLLMAISWYFKDELQSLIKVSSDNAKDVSNNSSNSKSKNAPHSISDFEQITSLKNKISLLKSENRLLKDDFANKQRCIEILLNFNESKIQSRHNKTTSPSLIQKNTNTGSSNTVHEKKDEQRIKDVHHIKDGKTVLENEVTPENTARKKIK